MKKKFTFIVSMLTALMMAFSLAACGDEESTGGGGGGALTIAQVEERVQDMPISNDEDAIEDAIDEVFGVELNLPTGTYETQVYSAGGTSAYVVTVSGTNTTAADYYNSIKAEMISEGYTPEDSELAFYKITGNVVYSAAVEANGNDVVVVFGATSITGTSGGGYSEGVISGGTESGGTSSGVLPQGNLSAYPAATINAMFSELGVTIPNCTSGSSYSIDSSYSSTANGAISITVTCYGMTAEERAAYTQALKDVGFRSQYYLIYSHSNRCYSELIASSTYHDENQTFTITFSTVYEEPAYTLPENVKITYSTGNYYYTAMKIGNDYYVEAQYSYDGTTMNFDYQLYYKWVEGSWELWEDYGDGWEKSSYGNETEVEYVEGDIFGFLVEEAEIDEYAVQGDDATVLGKTVEVWDYDTGYGSVCKYYKDVETGIILKYEATSYGYTMISSVTSIDTSITSFSGVELPQ